VSSALKLDWDIIHLSAHGTTNTLWLEDGLGGTYDLTVDEFIKWISPSSLKLLVISACSTIEIGQKVHAKISSSYNGNINVVAIQGNMDDTASTIFAQQFYQVDRSVLTLIIPLGLGFT
jgi:hypothetical protein